jgi:hypothetical protein
VHGFRRKGLQYEQVERALDEIVWFTHT